MLHHPYIGTEHIPLGLIHEGEGLAAQALESMGISLEAVRTRAEETVGEGGKTSAAGRIPFTPRVKKVLELGLREALHLGHDYIDTEHILLGLVREGEGVAALSSRSSGPTSTASAAPSSDSSAATAASRRPRRSNPSRSAKPPPPRRGAHRVEPGSPDPAASAR